MALVEELLGAISRDDGAEAVEDASRALREGLGSGDAEVERVVVDRADEVVRAVAPHVPCSASALGQLVAVLCRVGNPRELLVVVLEVHEVTPCRGFSFQLPLYLSILYDRLQPRHQAIEALSVLRALSHNVAYLVDIVDPEEGAQHDGLPEQGGAEPQLPALSAVAAVLRHQAATAHKCLDARAHAPEATAQASSDHSTEFPPCAHGSARAPARSGAGERAKLQHRACGMALRGVEFAATAAMVARDSHEGGVEPHCAGLPRSGALSSAVHAAVGAARARHRLALSRAPRPSPEEEQEEDALQPPLLAYACALAAPLLARAGFAGHDMAEAVALVARMDRGNDWPGDATSSRAKQSPLFRAVTERGPLAVGLMAAWTATAAATGGEELRRAWNASWPAPLSPPHRARLALGAAAPLLAHTWEPARRWGVLLLLASLPRSPAAVAFRSPFRIRAKPQREEIDLDGYATGITALAQAMAGDASPRRRVDAREALSATLAHCCPRLRLDVLCRNIAVCPVQQSVVHAVDELRRNVCTALRACARGETPGPFAREHKVLQALHEALGAAQRVERGTEGPADGGAPPQRAAAGQGPSTPAEDAADTVTSAANTLRVVKALDKDGQLMRRRPLVDACAERLREGARACKALASAPQAVDSSDKDTTRPRPQFSDHGVTASGEGAGNRWHLKCLWAEQACADALQALGV